MTQHAAIVTRPHGSVTRHEAIATSHNGDRTAFPLRIGHCPIKVMRENHT
ncbi:MAG: hypothetical protein KME11_20210 [Timaviella obliquedivisa GSE-PSE-MK23-08B]|nr:hypothetical protein [Timaviella obliquedivisa GSE-PSE-MK23-08B]